MQIMKGGDSALCMLAEGEKKSLRCDILKHLRVIEKRKLQILLKLFMLRHAHFLIKEVKHQLNQSH